MFGGAVDTSLGSVFDTDNEKDALADVRGSSSLAVTVMV
jgi:hypothetical protein